MEETRRNEEGKKKDTLNLFLLFGCLTIIEEK